MERINKQELQDTLNKYRFMHNGKDLFPKCLEDFTDKQLKHFKYLVYQKGYLTSLKDTERKLSKLKKG